MQIEIRKRKFRWIGHTLRKEDGEISKSALFWNPQGNRKRGRPRNSWRRSVNKEAGRSWNELRFFSSRQTEVERTHRQPMFLERNDGLYYYYYKHGVNLTFQIYTQGRILYGFPIILIKVITSEFSGGLLLLFSMRWVLIKMRIYQHTCL